jgi:gliding motility-associated-like protein
MNSTIIRSNTLAPGWYKYPNQPYYDNTPDINDSAEPVHVDPGWVWWDGKPVASPDHGTWANVWKHENFAQTIYGLTIGTTYYFRYYYASQGIGTVAWAVPAVQPYAPDVTVIGATGYANPSSSKLFEWSTYSGALIATSDSITIICSEGKFDGYIAYDGFYLGKNQPDNFLEVKSPDSVTLCGSGNASFTVQSDAGASYQWQTGYYDWVNVNDREGVIGSQTNTLFVRNTTTALNQTEYRCVVTTSCCSAVSSPALLVVAPLPKPVLKINPNELDICGMTSLVISTDSFYHDYLWNDNSRSQKLDVTHPGTYWVEVTDSNNCKGRDSITILPCEKLAIPNAFTPNGDGINDVFRPTVYGTLLHYTLTIYDRWGHMIFRSSNPGKGWDGTLSGVLQPNGTYVWNCQYQLLGNKPDHKSGTVILIR